MAGTIYYDTDASPFTAGIDGDSWARGFWINGLLNGVDPLDPDIPALIIEAYGVIPDTNTPAPAPIVNMFIRSVTLDRFWCDDQAVPSWAARGVVNYATPTQVGGGLSGSVPDANGPGVTLATSSSVQEIDVYYDVNGVQLTTTNDNAVQAHRGVGFANVSTFTFTRVEDVNPRQRNNNYTGKLNSLIWNGYEARTVLCANIDTRSDDGENYVTTYTFEYKPASLWQSTFIHDDPFYPGNPIPLSVADPGALLVADTIPTIDFSGLNIAL